MHGSVELTIELDDKPPDRTKVQLERSLFLGQET